MRRTYSSAAATERLAPYDESMCGLLRVHVDDTLAPSVPRLELSLRHIPSHNTAAITSVVAVFCRLYQTIETDANSLTDREDSWTSILTSRVMESPLSPDHHTVWWFKHHLAHSRVAIIVNGTDVAFSTVLHALETFVSMRRDAGVNPLVLSLVLAPTYQDSVDFEALRLLLQCESSPATSSVARGLLHRLKMSGRRLFASDLAALERLVASITVGDLHLDHVLPKKAGGSVPLAFGSLGRLFRPRMTSTGRFPWACASLETAYLKALSKALEESIPRLRKLQLMVPMETARYGTWLARIMFSTREYAQSGDIYELKLVGANEEIFKGFSAELQAMLLPFEKAIRQALKGGVPVRCRVNAIPTKLSDGRKLDTSTIYSVTEISKSGGLTLTKENTSLKLGAPLTSITTLYIGDGVFHWTPRFNTLTLGGESTPPACLALVVPPLRQLVIPDLKLDAASQATLLGSCPLLTKLVAYNLEAPENIGALIQAGRLQHLRTLDLLRSRQTRGVTRQFADLFRATSCVSLQHLRLPVPGADEDQEGLLQLLELNESLVVVDV